MIRPVLYVRSGRSTLGDSLRASLDVLRDLGPVEVRRMPPHELVVRVHRELEALLTDPDKPIPYEVLR